MWNEASEWGDQDPLEIEPVCINTPRGFLCVHRMNDRKKGAQSPETMASEDFICSFARTKILAVEMGKRGGYESDYEEGNAGFEVRAGM